MTICFFGDYDPEYSRNRVLMKGLRENGVQVVECHSATIGFGSSLNLVARLIKLRRRYDIVFVGYSDSRFPVFLAWICSRAPLVWDAFYSRYDNYVFERRLVARWSLKALYYWFTDWLACVLSDRILLDTNEHIAYFVQLFHVTRNKYARILVGSDSSIFYPRDPEPSKDFLIHFHGKYTPLQGIETIIRAAKLLEGERDIVFQCIGTGAEYRGIRQLAESLGIVNIRFIDKVAYGELALFMSKAQICLGIFGNTGKTQRVIPNKIYEAIAMGKPVITGDTPAIREEFTDGKDIQLVRIADPQDLANKIVLLKRDSNRRLEMAHAGYALFQQRAIPSIIGRSLIDVFKKFLS